MEKEKNLNHNTKTKPKKKSRIGVVLVTSAILGVSIAGYGALQSESPVVWSLSTASVATSTAVLNPKVTSV